MKFLDNSGVTKATLAIIVAVLAIVLVAGAVVFTATTQPNSITSSTSQNTSSASSASNVDTSKYLGYLPAGYQVIPKSSNSATFPCPAGMTSTQCQQFQATCGNGVCDPNERCDTCPIDCGPSGTMVCDPYTGRPGAPAQICQANGHG